ncbi:MAG: acyl-CoA dehydrogenase family protein [Acidimicrobiales bacterium]|nr:acyl-CoA dehydrogenase family protein [Acidimicrobiales bacterium]
MHIGDTPDEAAFRAEARAWLEANAVPKGHPDDFSVGSFGDLDEADYVERARTWQRTLHDGGWAALTWPTAAGGQGKPAICQSIFNQEQADFGVTSGPFVIAIGMVGPTLLRHGTLEQQQRFLPPMLRGDELWCQLFSEPGAGSDLASLATRAEPDGDEFVVTGQKVWTSAVSRARWGILLARTDPAVPKRDGITYFLLDMRSPGIEPRPLRQMTGDAHFAEVFLDEVRIPATHVVGEVGGGWTPAKTTLTAERGAIAGGSTGVDAASLIRLAQDRGRNDDALVRHELTSAHIRQELLRFLRYRMLTAISQGKRPGPEASVMKLAYAEHLSALTGTALAIQGPLATLAGDVLPAKGMWSKRFLHSPSVHIAGGTDEVQRNIVGEQVLGMPVEPSADRGVPFRELTRGRA